LGFGLTATRCLGLVGSRPVVLGLLRSLICQAATHHGPADARVAVLTDASRLSDWDWAKWLPHTRSADEASGRRLLAAEHTEVEAVLGEVGVHPGGPLTLVIVDADGLTEGRNARAREVLASSSGPVAGLVVASSTDRLPSVCTGVVQFDGPDGDAVYSVPSSGVAVEHLLVAGLAEVSARRCARALAGLEDPEVSESGGNL